MNLLADGYPDDVLDGALWAFGHVLLRGPSAHINRRKNRNESAK